MIINDCYLSLCEFYLNDAVRMSVRPRIYGSASDTFEHNGRHRAVEDTTAAAAAAATEGAVHGPEPHQHA